jgi:hypothetical protein
MYQIKSSAVIVEQEEQEQEEGRVGEIEIQM